MKIPWRSVVGLCWLILLGSAQAVDMDGDGMCDVWEARYHAGGLAPGGDADGDGWSNGDEAAAGTDPLDGRSRLQPALAGLAPAAVTITAPTQPGKRYQVLTAPSPAGPWTPFGTPQLALAGSVDLPGPRSGDRLFYRVEVTNADSDGDGVDDWAELQLFGYDRENGDSFASGTPGNDLAAVQEYLTALSTGQVTASATTPAACEKEDTPAVITYSRSGITTRPFTLFLATGGASDPTKSSAGPGEWSFKDAGGAAVTGRLLLPAGASAVELRVHPVADALTEVPEHLRVLVGGTTLDTGVTLTDASNLAANDRLFLAFLRPDGVASPGSGIATILLRGDNDQAAVNVNFGNLTSEQQNAYLNLATVPPSPGLNIIVPLGRGQLDAVPWAIRAAQALTTDQAMLEALLQSRIFLAVTSAQFAEGEIEGSFAAATGSVEPPVHPDPGTPATLAGTELRRDVARFLTQATFGPTEAEITALYDEIVNSHGGDRMAGYAAWINRQLDPLQTPDLSFESLVRAADGHEFTLRNTSPRIFDYIDGNNHPSENNRRREWWTMALQAKAQLRQRAAFALSEIFVVSDNDGTVANYQYGLADYWDMLARNATGTYRQLLEDVSRHPIMGVYLSHLKNRGAYPSGATTINPDENYAREIMQLLSIGLVHLHPDGSLKLGPGALPIPTYDQTDITEMARVFTGLSYSKVAQSLTFTVGGVTRNSRRGPPVDNTSFSESGNNRYFPETHLHPLKMFDGYSTVSSVRYYYHDFGAKTLFHGQGGIERVIAAKSQSAANAEADLAEALDALAGHPNVAPFISRLLIQRFTTSNPSAGYVQRVASAWGGSNGNIGQVIRAILLDFEARDLATAEGVGAGKLREPILRLTHLLRAFGANTDSPVALLTNYLDGFTLPTDALASDYHQLPAADLDGLVAGASRFRINNVDNSLNQTPLRSPTVFNWFLPDYLVPGPAAEAGLVLPEFQLANETNVISQTNYLYTPVFNSATPAYKYYNSGGITGTGYSVDTFIGQGGTSPDTYRENIRLDFTAAINTWNSAYNTAIGAGQTTTQANATAAAALVDWLDGFLTCGRLKAKYGDNANQPRQLIIDAVKNTTDVSNPADLKPLHRIRTAVYLVLNSAEHLIQK